MAKIFQGTSGWVSVEGDTASKYISVIEGNYWMREFTALLYLGQFNHSNVVPLKSYGTVYRRLYGKKEIRLFTEMKFPAYKCTLEDLFSNAITDQMIFQWMIDICSAVSLCHKCGIMHRDIKPSNIMIEDGRAILIDYTHCYKQVPGNKHLDDSVVTYSHRAKEVFAFQAGRVSSYNEKIDVWAIGIMLIEMCMGKPFFSLVGRSTESDMQNLFTKDEKKYMTTVKNILACNMNTKLQHGYLYYWLITQILKQNVDERPSAEHILDVFIVNARAIGMKVEVPTTLTKKEIDSGIKHMSSCKIPNELMLIVPNHRMKLLEYCTGLWRDIQAIYKSLDVGHVIDWFTYTINTGFTNFTNWRLVVIASTSIINTLICDYLMDIRDVTLTIYKMVKLDIKLKEVELFTVEFFKHYAMEIINFNAMVDLTKVKKDIIVDVCHIKTPKRKTPTNWLAFMADQQIV